jgi:hypothetical protein
MSILKHTSKEPFNMNDSGDRSVADIEKILDSMYNETRPHLLKLFEWMKKQQKNEQQNVGEVHKDQKLMHSLHDKNCTCNVCSTFDKSVSVLRKNYLDLMIGADNNNIVPYLNTDILRNMDRMAYQCLIVKNAYAMGGLPNIPKKFHNQTPWLHVCDVNEIVCHLNEKRKADDYDGVVYVNACADGKYYVGISKFSYLPLGVERTPINAAKSRYEAHLQNGGGAYPTYWTHFYPVSGLLFTCPGTYADEDLITLLMACSVGWNNVRGGRWTQAYCLPEIPENINVIEILNGLGVDPFSQIYKDIVSQLQAIGCRDGVLLSVPLLDKAG